MPKITHFPLFLDDWSAGVAKLDAAERGVYISLLVQMYEEAGPIQRDDDRLFRQCGCATKNQFRIALNTLIEFGYIDQDNGVISNKKTEKILKKIASKSSQARRAVEERWRKIRNKNNDSEDTNVYTGENTGSDTEEILSESLKPKAQRVSNNVSNETFVKPTGIDAVQIQQAFDDWNTFAQHFELSVAEKLNDQRKSQIRQRLKDSKGKAPTLNEGFQHVLRRASKSSFLMGKKSDYKLTLDSFLRKKNYQKILEGGHDDNVKQTGGFFGAAERIKDKMDEKSQGTNGPDYSLGGTLLISNDSQDE